MRANLGNKTGKSGNITGDVRTKPVDEYVLLEQHNPWTITIMLPEVSVLLFPRKKRKPASSTNNSNFGTEGEISGTLTKHSNIRNIKNGTNLET